MFISALLSKNKEILWENKSVAPTMYSSTPALIRVWRQNHVFYHILNIVRPGTFQYINLEGMF